MNAVAPYAAFVLPVESRMETITKQKHSPIEQIISSVRRPNRSMRRTGIAEPTRYVHWMAPPRIMDRFRPIPMVVWNITGP